MNTFLLTLFSLTFGVGSAFIFVRVTLFLENIISAVPVRILIRGPLLVFFLFIYLAVLMNVSSAMGYSPKKNQSELMVMLLVWVVSFAGTIIFCFRDRLTKD